MPRFLQLGALVLGLTALCGEVSAAPSPVGEEGEFTAPGVTQTEQELAPRGAILGVSAAHLGDARIEEDVDMSLPAELVGARAAARREWTASGRKLASSRDITRQPAGLWRAGAYIGGRVFRDPFADGDCPAPPCLASNSISFRLGPDLQGRPNAITNLRIQFLATLRKSDGTSEGRSIFFSDTPGETSVDEFDATPSLDLSPRLGAQTFNFQVRGDDSQLLFQVRLKLTWNKQTKRFTASMNATSGLVDGQQYTASTVLASGPTRTVRDGAGVVVGISGAMRRTGP